MTGLLQIILHKIKGFDPTRGWGKKAKNAPIKVTELINLVINFVPLPKNMHFVSFSHFIHFRMLYYENKDRSGITANIYIPLHYSNNKAALAIHFSILHSCDQK